jgi:hypothetical protein
MDGITTEVVHGITPTSHTLIVEHIAAASQVCVMVGIAETIVVDVLSVDLVVLTELNLIVVLTGLMLIMVLIDLMLIGMLIVVVLILIVIVVLSLAKMAIMAVHVSAQTVRAAPVLQ